MTQNTIMRLGLTEIAGMSAVLAAGVRAFHLSPSLRQLNSKSKPPTPPYYYDPRIHVLGNVGPSGWMHALIAPAFTKFLDVAVYDSINVRRACLGGLDQGSKKTLNAIDLCCGTGCSTRAIVDRFPNAEIEAVDSSPEMLDVAKMMTFCPKVRYHKAPVEDYNFTGKKFDLATCMFAMHEMPEEARLDIGSKALRALRPGKGQFIVVDIHPTYKPHDMMIMGEPHILEYLKHVDGDMMRLALTHFCRLTMETLVEGHVKVWKFSRL